IKGNVIHIEEDSKFLKQMWKVYEAALFDEIDSVYKCSNYAYGLIMELLDYYNHNQRKLSLNPKVSKSKEYIDNNYDKLIGLEEICEKVGVSKYYLCREFLKEVGLTPGNYLLKVRMQAAAKLLLFAKDMTVEEISQNVGFSCGNYFSKVFKKSLGVSPTEFRTNDNLYD
ncbi:helix-turn-helix domain-containing protein, partial [Clostridium perfringens]|nr:helix-turn-helix domain-containing protein [Clostridium perfringens]